MATRDNPPTSPDDVAPRVALRVPGPWTSPQAFAAALSEHDTGFDLVDDGFVETATGRRFEWGVSPPDDQIAGLIEHSGRLSAQESRNLRRHACKIHLEGPGGSVDAARDMMRAATALIRAGGCGVLVDSSVASHGPTDWLKLAGDTSPGGLYWAYVMVSSGGAGEILSCGMHCLGLRDAELPEPPDREFGGFVLHNFLGYTYQSGVPVLDGDPVGDEETALYRVRHRPCTRFDPGHPCFNPYGVWRLEPTEEGDEGDEEPSV